MYLPKLEFEIDENKKNILQLKTETLLNKKRSFYSD